MSSSRREQAISGIRLHIFIGGTEYPRAPRAWIEAVRHQPLSRAGITLPDPVGEEAKRIAKGDRVEVRIGYRDEEPWKWEGTIEWARPGTVDQIEIGVVGKEKIFSQTKILESWQNETAESIMRYGLQQTGLTIKKIQSAGTTIPRFIASNVSVWQLAEQIEHSLSRSFRDDVAKWALWLDSQGNANWGDFEEPADVYEISSGGALITHNHATDSKGRGVVQSFLLPGIWHSQLFRLKDARRSIDQQYRATGIRHEINRQSARTFIAYGVEHGRYA